MSTCEFLDKEPNPETLKKVLKRSSTVIKNIDKELDKLRTLKDNWDSCGAKKPEKEVIDLVRKFIINLMCDMCENNLNYTLLLKLFEEGQCYIGPGYSGYVLLELDYYSNSLHFIFNEDLTLDYVEYRDDLEDPEVFPVTNPTNLIERLLDYGG